MREINLFVFVLLLFSCLYSHAQDYIPEDDNYPYDQWTPELINRANTITEADYLNDEEKKVIFYCNLARINGELFSITFLQHYIDYYSFEITDNIQSLFSDLKATSDLPVLIPQFDLYEIAKGHAVKSGKTGHIGHEGFYERFEKVYGSKYYTVAENCDYGNDDALSIVMSLLIDEGIPSLGHRKNILHEEMNSIGVSLQPHSEYRHNCVMDFGGAR